MRTDTERLDYLLQGIATASEDVMQRLNAAITLGLEGRAMVDAAMGAKLVEPGEPMPELTALDLAVAELGRIRNVKGFSEERDDGYVGGELVNAAVCYLLGRIDMPAPDDYEVQIWPWGLDTFKPSPDDRKRELTKSIALALCELDRLIRAERREDEAQVRTEREQESRMPEGVHVVKPAYDVRVDVFRPIEIGVPREFKVGDRVRVVRAAEWAGWVPDMNAMVGRDFILSDLSDVDPECVKLGDWWVPVGCLEHVDG